MTSASAAAACDKAAYRAFATDARAARRLIIKAPAAAQRGFEALSNRASLCFTADRKPEDRYKLQLFQIGLEGYIGAARAEQGDPSGAVMVREAQNKAQDVLRAHPTGPQHSYAQALIEQLSVPDDIIGRLKAPAHAKPLR